jgi:RimJ/RimL family protein N-acetyltransferase
MVLRMKAILRDVPDQIETPRLILRSPRAGDGPGVYTAVLESLEELRPWMPWARVDPTVEASEEYCRQSQADYLVRRNMNMIMILKETGQVAGGTGLHSINWEVPRFEIGYWIRTPLQGRGLVREAVEGLTRLCFDGLGARRVEIRCDSRNERSARVARAAGYVLVATLEQNVRAADGSLEDTLVFAQVSSAPDPGAVGNSG